MKKLLIFIIFVAGYLVMSLEIIGFRVLAPYFGLSVFVSGTLIGLILGALAGGYYLGGWLAENQKEIKKLPLYLFAVASVFLLFDIFSYKFILGQLLDWTVLWGSFLASLSLFFAPAVCLAAVSPVVIKIMSEQEKTGRSAGLVYAWGTAGSLLGVFLTTFLLIPSLGSRLALYSCFLLALAALAAILLLADWKKSFWVGLLLLISFLTWRLPVLPSDVILETESAYNQIRLIDKEKMIYLTLNSQRENLAQTGYVKEGTLINLSLVDLFNLGPVIAPVKDLLVLGMSGGISVKQHQQYAPQARIDAVEIDPKIIEIAKERFGVKESENLKIFEEDARPFLAKSKKSYDMIEIDLFQGSPYIPFYVLTKEFFQSVDSHLNSEGLMMMNIYAPGGRDILATVLATMNSVFPSVYKIGIFDNFVILATRSQTTLEEIKSKIKNKQIEISSDLKFASDYALVFLEQSESDKKAPVFTDDWAPVELLTYKMLKGLKI